MLLLLGAVVLLLAWTEVWGLLASAFLAAISKVGLLSNISIGAQKKLSISVTAVKLSLWPHVWGFLRSPTQARLLHLAVPAVHLVVVLFDEENPRGGATALPSAAGQSFWQTLDMKISLKSTHHPVWVHVRQWMPHLRFVCRFAHLVGLSMSSISMEVQRKVGDNSTTVVSVKRGSVSLGAQLDPKRGELMCSVAIARHEPMQVAIPVADAGTEIGFTEFKVTIPVAQSIEDTRSPIPSLCSAACDLIQVNVMLTQMLRVSLAPPQRYDSRSAFDPTEVIENYLQPLACHMLLPLRLAEASPDAKAFLRRLKVNVLDGEQSCSLILNNLEMTLSITSSESLGAASGKNDGRPVVRSKAELFLGSLVADVQDTKRVDCGDAASPVVTLSSLKIEAQSKLAVETPEELDDAGANEGAEGPLLFCKTFVSGEGRSLAGVISETVQPWISSICTQYDLISSEVREGEEGTSARTGDVIQCDGNDPMGYMDISLDVQFKMLKTEVTFISLDHTCEVLPKGVPSIYLTLEEVNVFAHPFVREDQLGVRSKADIQCSRLMVSCFTNNSHVKTAFLSLDSARVFICPVSLWMHGETSASVEMEVQRVEVKWTPAVLHAIGGMLEIGVFILAPILREPSHPPAGQYNDDSNEREWASEARLRVPTMRRMDEVAQDQVSLNERIGFQCAIKCICVTFAYTYENDRHVDYLTVDTLMMSVEETTGRFRISMFEAKAFPSQRTSDGRRWSTAGIPKHIWTSRRRGSFMPNSSPSCGLGSHLECIAGVRGVGAGNAEGPRHYFSIDCFSLEENKLPRHAKTVVDIFLEGARVEWSLEAQLRLTELIRRITFSSWEMIYRIRSAYAAHCTPPGSIYNRPYGLNPPLDDIDECLRYEQLFGKLISASGDNLVRLRAMSILVEAKLIDGIDVKLSAGVFGGDDLPEVWILENISLKVEALEMIRLDRLSVRHTVGKRTDYVFGEFEDMLRKRRSASGRPAACQTGDLPDGLMVDVEGLQLRSSSGFPLQAHLHAIQSSFAPYQEQLASAMAGYWRPQQELFYQFFLRTPVASRKPDVWLQLENVGFELIDKPLESWLERMYPLWIEELAEQELRAQMLEDHVAALKLTNADLLCDDAYQEMKSLLAEKNAKIYAQKVHKSQATHRKNCESRGGCNETLLAVHAGRVGVDLTFEEEEERAVARARQLDEASEAVEATFKGTGRDWVSYKPVYLLLVGMRLKVSASDLGVRIRRFPTPLLLCAEVGVEGDVIVAANASGSSGSGESAVFDFMGAIRCFADLSVAITQPVLYFSPSYLYALDELAELAQGLLPLIIMDVDKRYHTSPLDVARRLCHGKIAISVQDPAVRLLCSSSSFELTDYLQVSVHQLHVVYANGVIDIAVTRLSAKIEPGALSNITEVSHVKLQIWLKFDCCGDVNMHYAYPIEFVSTKNTSSSADRFILHCQGAPNANPATIPACSESAQFADPRSSGPFEAYQTTGLSIFIRGKICPVDPDVLESSSSDGWSKRDMAARAAIVLYTKQVEWLIGFGRVYKKIPLHPFPRRQGSRRGSHLPLLRLPRVLKGVIMEAFDLIGLDVALYASEKRAIGLRAFIDDKIGFSGALLESSHILFSNNDPGSSTEGKNEAEVRRLPLDLGGITWIVHDVTVVARDLHVRVCTPRSGSRGESLVSVKHVALKIGGGTEHAPTHDSTATTTNSKATEGGSSNQRTSSSDGLLRITTETATKTKKSILEHFDIHQDNPFHFRDSDDDPSDAETGENVAEDHQAAFFDEFQQLGFLLGLSSSEVRVLVTLDALETLVDVANNWIHVIIASLPELFDTTPEDSAPRERKDMTDTATIPTESEGGSPKKPTSLAEDPKFGKIFLQSTSPAFASDESQEFEPTPYSNSDSVAPARRRSSGKTGLLRRFQQIYGDKSSHGSSSKIVEAFLMVKFVDCQISIQDQQNKGSVLLALSTGTLKDAVSSLSDNSQEHIDLQVAGLQLFTSPLDIDVKSHGVWLKAFSDGSYCPSSYGLLKQVISPIPARVTIWIDRETVIDKNKVKLKIPTVEAQLNAGSKDILQNLGVSVATLVTVKLTEKKGPEYSRMLRSYLRESQNSSQQQQQSSLQHLHALRKQLKWEIATIRWRQLCRWSYSVNERSMTAFSTVENTRALPHEVETSPLFRRRKLSSTSISSATTNASMLGSAPTQYDDEQFADDLQRLSQQYDSVSELIRLIANEDQKQNKKNPLPNVDLEFVLESASLTLSGDTADIARVQSGILSFKMKQFEDHSGSFALTLQDLSAKNLSPGTAYPDLLLPAYSRSWEGDDMFLRVDAEIAKPVGGITVVQHFELNVHPVQVCITQEVVIQLAAFFAPPTTDNSVQEEKRKEVRSQFLQPKTTSSSSDGGRVGSVIKKAVKVAGKAASHPLARGRTQRGHSDDDAALPGKKPAAGTGFHLHEDTPDWISRLVSQPDANDIQLLNLERDFEHLQQQQSDSTEREISEMKDRAKSSILFKRIRLGAVEVVVTYRNKRSTGSGHLHLHHASTPQPLEDMRGFEVKTHALVYCDKTCSPVDLLLRIRRDILLDVLSQVGRNFTNIGNFLRDQFDISRWAPFDALAPLKTLSAFAISSHSGAVKPLLLPPDDTSAPAASRLASVDTASNDSSATVCEDSRMSSGVPSAGDLRLTEAFEVSTQGGRASAHDIVDTMTADGSSKVPSLKPKRSFAKIFSRKKSASSLPSPTVQSPTLQSPTMQSPTPPSLQ